VLADAGIEVVKIPLRCPRANCFAERLVLTIRTGIIDRLLIFGKRNLGRVSRVLQHAVASRALQLRPTCPLSPVPEPVYDSVGRRSVLGGLINEYEPAA
jgi:hypothetical protein